MRTTDEYCARARAYETASTHPGIFTFMYNSMVTVCVLVCVRRTRKDTCVRWKRQSSPSGTNSWRSFPRGIERFRFVFSVRDDNSPVGCDGSVRGGWKGRWYLVCCCCLLLLLLSLSYITVRCCYPLFDLLWCLFFSVAFECILWLYCIVVFHCCLPLWLFSFV